MTGTPDQTMLTYLGWSGFDVRYAQTVPVLIDPPDDAGIPTDRDICLLVTHGHPEHIAGAAACLANEQREGAATVFASPGICRKLRNLSRNDRDTFHDSQAGDTHAVDGMTIDVFLCRHMPLLPPEKGQALARLRQLAGNPRLLASIVADVIRFPIPGPTLGFRLTRTGGPGILFFGEGLHRCAGRDRVAEVGARLPGDTLIAAVEPEDVSLMPALVAATGAVQMVPYEAHAPWRRGFGMPCADLDVFSTDLQTYGYRIIRVEPGTPVPLS